MSKENYSCVNVASDGETSVGKPPPTAYARPRSSAQQRKGFILGRDRGTKNNRRKTDEGKGEDVGASPLVLGGIYIAQCV